MSPERVAEWASLLAKRANTGDWPMSAAVFEPFVISIAAEAKGWRDAECELMPEPEASR